MKKLFLTILVSSSLMTLVITSCQKDNATTTSFTATMEQCQEQDGKTAMVGSTMQWVSGDQIKVFGTAGSGIYQAVIRGSSTTFNLVSGDAGRAPYRAVYPAAAANDDGTIELPVVQVTTNGSLTGFPMYTESNGTALDFKNLCGILRLRLQKSGVSVTAIEITGDIELTGDFSVTYNGGTPTIAYSGHGTKTTMLTCSTPQSISRQKDFYLFLPDHIYTCMRIRIYSSDGKVCTKTLNANQSINIQRSMITTITMGSRLSFTQDAGVLPGLFTIDAEGHQIRFSQGNLQYTTLGTHAVGNGGAEQGIWRFAPEQYECVGWDNRNISSTYPKWIDYFGWGTSGWNSGAVCYQPWSTSTRNSDYYPGGSSTNELTGAYAEADWAWHNAISNGGDVVYQWHTLTSAEWSYLLNTRTNASAKRGTGNVNGVGGLIILPDSWTLPSGCSFTEGFAEYDENNYSDWTHNSYTLSQWADMEIAGAVFLPAAGDRWNDVVGYYGYYWSSTPDDVYGAYNMNFSSYNIYAASSYRRTAGFSVRPVQD